MSNRKIGPFELGEKLGAGGMGIVYRAVYTKTGIPCAIKVLAPDVNDSTAVQQRFEREIAILKKLQHPHIVRYYGGGKVGNQRFYAMELVPGGSLESYLKAKRKLPWEEALEFARQIAEALEHAHNAGVIHRDLKPANLLMTPDRQLKLTDFGIARDTTATALTAAGKTVGTYAYMAPEQIRGKPPVDRRTDLYALGCVLFEMLTGETPFEGDNPGDVLVKHLQEEPLRVTSFAPDCPIWLEDLVFRLLEKDPENRPYDALAVQVALEEVRQKVAQQASLVGNTLAGNATKTQGAGAAADVRAALGKKKKRKKREQAPFYEQLWFLVLCLVLLAGTAYGVYWWRNREAYLFARAEALMSTENEANWLSARDYYLKPLLAKYPQGEFASKAQEYLERIEITFLERQARSRAMRNIEPKSPAEAVYMEADRYERFGDRITALHKYESLIDIFKNETGDNRLFVQMARQRVAKMRAEGLDKRDVVQIVEDALKRADELEASGQASKRIEARNLWNSIVELYADNQELAAHVEIAQERLRRKPGGK
jgi:serine/threonine-protein kinase